MSKNILDFLSSYEDELNSQAAFYEKNISRIEGQIKDTKKQITAIKKNIDKEYNVFSATQSNNVDTEINTLNQIIESKKKQIDDINKKKQEIINKLEDIKHLNYKNLLGKEPVENIYDKLTLIRKFMDIDLHRAKMEMDKLLKLF